MIIFDNNKHKLFYDFIYTTSISPKTAHDWVKDGKIRLIKTDRGDAMSVESYNRLLFSDEVKEAFIKGLFYEADKIAYDRLEKQKNFLKKKCRYELDSCNEFINKLKKIHLKYIKNFDVIRDETPECLAYLIFAKVINILILISNLMKNGSTGCMILYRPLNESLMLAQYFLIMKNEPKGKKQLKEWFRKDKFPSPKDLKTECEKYQLELNKDIDKNVFEGKLRELYKEGSKSVHTFFKDLIKLLVLRNEGENVKCTEFQYSSSTNFREVYLNILYLKSMLLTVYTTFLICFHKISKILYEDDLISLYTLHSRLFDEIVWRDKVFNHLTGYKEIYFDEINNKDIR